ncbi:HD-GYP domain-containing protein [Aquibacillus koreensis]|uniref:HD-GYP domain-containing protein n=1 Tax=Aquibacillus koreensis TaxID=279446 RepID=A0A9X4AJE2_9BACI|nr:HD-GYP domain-containing protein [Aquibacillus koreensis]MCT2536908.1 HD-GYP domain-containing protein [Aquibacillus koreensis]MDC3421961.1 HD-GYP domain-containing protein [Aquibacillus koreensis]
MQKRLKSSALTNAEVKTTIWFLWLFYAIFIIYDVFYNYLLPELPWGSDLAKETNIFDYVQYIILFGLLPVSMFLLKNDKPYLIKYIFFIGLTSINIISDIWFYLGSEGNSYTNGNVVELFIILFSPIFVNKRFFYLVSIGTGLKYLVIGLAIQDPVVLFPILIVVVLSMIAYIILHRIHSYVEAVKKSYDKQLEGIVKGIIATLELKDPYTRGHSERVAEYAMKLARATNKFKKDELNSFYYTCLLHDIGKIHIPDSILIKPSKLTIEEYEIIKTHPTVGAKAVQQVEGIADYIDVIYYHHERWDGTGYPKMLKGEEIPYLARVTAIADAFDAMTSSRSYRAALPLEEAYKRIIDGKGTQFDPDLVDLFQETYQSWVEFYESYIIEIETMENNQKEVQDYESKKIK